MIDALGELVNIYAISDVVVLGGSFTPNVGGHNPIEAAQFENSIITGEFIFNQKALFEIVSNVTFAKAKEVNELLKTELKKSRIISLGNADEIIEDIKRNCEEER